MSKELRSALEKHEQKCSLEAQGPILSEKTTTLHIVSQAIAQLPFWQVLLRRNRRFHTQWHWQLASSERSSGKGRSDREGKPGWGTGVQTEHSRQWGLSHGSQGGRATAKQLEGASEWARARPWCLVQSRCGFWVYPEDSEDQVEGFKCACSQWALRLCRRNESGAIRTQWG